MPDTPLLNLGGSSEPRRREEFHRILRRGGTVQYCTPFRTVLKTYVRRNARFRRLPKNDRGGLIRPERGRGMPDTSPPWGWGGLHKLKNKRVGGIPDTPPGSGALLHGNGSSVLFPCCIAIFAIARSWIARPVESKTVMAAGSLRRFFPITTSPSVPARSASR